MYGFNFLLLGRWFGLVCLLALSQNLALANLQIQNASANGRQFKVEETTANYRVEFASTYVAANTSSADWNIPNYQYYGAFPNALKVTELSSGVFTTRSFAAEGESWLVVWNGTGFNGAVTVTNYAHHVVWTNDLGKEVYGQIVKTNGAYYNGTNLLMVGVVAGGVFDQWITNDTEMPLDIIIPPRPGAELWEYEYQGASDAVGVITSASGYASGFGSGSGGYAVPTVTSNATTRTVTTNLVNFYGNGSAVGSTTNGASQYDMNLLGVAMLRGLQNLGNQLEGRMVSDAMIALPIQPASTTFSSLLRRLNLVSRKGAMVALMKLYPPT